ncbi:enolase C-terminal domain-like protein [Nocardiopsis tropica]|nr:enolase C-terminal domain-like protein [Nocardiopsis tropica]
MSEILPIKQRALGEKVAGELRRLIVTGRYAPGTSLVEGHLAEQFDLSRGPIRDALKLLASEGLIDTNRRSATVVGLGGDDIDELFSLRGSLEQLALEIGLNRDRAGLAEGLRAPLEQMRRAREERDPDAFTAADVRFHSVFYDVAGHRRLADRIELPVAVGETLRNRYEFAQWLAAVALGLAQPDVGRTGVTEAASIAEVCSAHHVPVAPHHSVGLGPALAAGVHVSAATEDSPFFEYQPTTVETAAELGFHFDAHPDGIGLGSGPGLGLEVDEERVRSAAVRHRSTR